MKKSMKKALGLTILSFLTAWALFFVGGNQAQAADIPDPYLIPEDEFVLDIMPEYYYSEKTNDLFKTPQEAVGVSRVTTNPGGGVEQEKVAEIWKNIAFQIYDEEGKLVKIDKGSYSPGQTFGKGQIPGKEWRFSSSKFIFGLKKGKKYTVKVDTSTLPDNYYHWFQEQASNSDWSAYEDIMQVGTEANYHEGYEAVYDGTGDKPFAVVRFHLDIFSFAFVKNEEVAKNFFTMDGENVTGLNPAYKEGEDYFLKPVTKEGKPPKLLKEEVQKLFTEGYRPYGFYWNYDGTKYPGIQDVTDYHSYILWADKSKDGINSFEKSKTSSIFIITLDQRIPEVHFIKNIGDNPKEEVAKRQVYYQKSLSDNCVGDKCLAKDLPKASFENKVLVGWNTKKDGTGQAFTADTVVTKNMKVYAQWKDLDQVTSNVSFIKNIGENPSEEVAKVKVFNNKSLSDNCLGDKCLTKTLPEVTFEGKIFAGWNTKADGTGQAFTLDTVVTGDMTVYAQWKDKLVVPDKPDPKPQEEKDKVEVIGGKTRIETSELISGKFYKQADTVVIARSDLFPDALTASVLAKALDAPILLTHTDHLDAATAKEIQRLGAKKAYIMARMGPFPGRRKKKSRPWSLSWSGSAGRTASKPQALLPRRWSAWSARREWP